MRRTFLIALLCLCGNAFALADSHSDHAPAAAPEHGAQAAVHLPYHHPNLPADARWAGVTTLLILGSFVLAAGVGITVYVDAPPEGHSAHTHGHDDHAGAGHGHGAAGLHY